MTIVSAKSRGGFTLLEVILVVTLLVVIVSIAVPMFGRLYGDMRMDAAADTVRTNWAEARAHAMNEARPYRFAVKPGTNEFRVAPARVDYWPGTELPPVIGDISLGDSQPMDLSDSLPEGVTFSVEDASAPDDSGWVPYATFMPDGSCRDNVRLRIESSDFKPITLRLRGMTGSVRMYRGDDPEAQQ